MDLTRLSTTMAFNLNSGYGRLLAQKINNNPVVRDASGKTFVVAPSTHPHYSELQQIFVADPDGALILFNTITAALAACTANAGDVIIVTEGYTETITAAGTNVNVAGVRIVGMGDGANRPTITFTTAITANFLVTAANITIQNLVFTCNFDAITALVTVSTADVSFLDCEFNTNNGTMGAVVGLLTAATASRLKVLRCRFLGPATNTGTTTTAQLDHEVGVDYVIQDCYFTGKCTQNITNAAAILRGLIHNNVFVTATGTKSINMHASSTPMISNNRFNVPSGTAPIVAAAGFVIGNLYSAAAGVTAPTAATF